VTEFKVCLHERAVLTDVPPVGAQDPTGHFGTGIGYSRPCHCPVRGWWQEAPIVELDGTRIAAVLGAADIDEGADELN
jgi:hypothetical protein